jgi:tripartite-type tricarboxylate transporter receptor subunit TctC
MIGPKMSESWAQPVVVENRVGAGGTLGAALVAKATPDGHTLLLTSPALAVSAAVKPDLPYDTVKDFAGVSNIGFSTQVLVVAPALGVKSVKELIALARAQPGKILFGSAGAGSTTHMSGERFRFVAGIKATHVGFKGQPEFLIEIMAGRIHYGVGGLTVMLSLITDGRLLALAVAQRTPLLPEVPAYAEVLPGWGRDGSQMLLAPAGTPRPVLEKISREVARILDLPEVRVRLQAVSFHIAPSKPGETDKMLRADIATFSKVARQAGLIAR